MHTADPNSMKWFSRRSICGFEPCKLRTDLGDLYPFWNFKIHKHKLCLSFFLTDYISFLAGLTGTNPKLTKCLPTSYIVSGSGCTVQCFNGLEMDKISWGEVFKKFYKAVDLFSLCLPPHTQFGSDFILFGAIYINSHWLEPSYQVSRPMKHVKHMLCYQYCPTYLVCIISRERLWCFVKPWSAI